LIPTQTIAATMPAKGDPETRRTLIRMVILCFVLQILAIGAFHQYRVRAGNDNYGFGW